MVVFSENERDSVERGSVGGMLLLSDMECKIDGFRERNVR
jgi:hypothetical protein